MFRTALGFCLAAWLVATAAAAPAPAPPSAGPISDAVALRAALPKTAPPLAASAVIPEDGVVALQRQAISYVAETTVEAVIQPDGKKVEVARTVTRPVFQQVEFRVKLDAVKFYTVSQDGKLESLDAARAKGLLKRYTPVLTGEGADVDPRNLELVRAGTIYLVLPPPTPELRLPPDPRREDK